MSSDISTLVATAAVERPGVDPRSVLGLDDATKSFGGTIAIRNVSLNLHAGEVLALLGENGAGKSTCVKLLTGLYQPDSGAVILDRQPVVLRSPLDAFRRGIAVVHQHPGLFGDLSVTENIFLGHMPRDRFGRVDHREMRRAAAALLNTVGLSADPGTLLKHLRSSEQQLVEIITREDIMRALAARGFVASPQAR